MGVAQHPLALPFSLCGPCASQRMLAPNCTAAFLVECRFLGTCQWFCRFSEMCDAALDLKRAGKTAEESAAAGPRYEELLFYSACVCHCWCLCLCVCVCVKGRVCRRGAGGAGEGGGMRVSSSSSWRCQLSRAMRLALRWCRRRRPQRGAPGGRLLELWSYGTLLLKSLYSNSLTDGDTLLDCAFEPVYWIVDNVTRWFGAVFVCLVVLLTTSVVVIVYLFVLPTIISTYPSYWVAWHLSCGHWLLVMVVFHYYKVTTTSPGHSPKDEIHIPSVSICKKCITPKPPRTHHCSICNTCVLKMDHHCRILLTSNTLQKHEPRLTLFHLLWFCSQTAIFGHVDLNAFSSLGEQLRGPLQPPLLLLLLRVHDAGLLLLQHEQQSLVSGGLRRDREILSDPRSDRNLPRDHCSEEHHLPLGADQHGVCGSRRTHPLAHDHHQQRRDQRGASHQQQRDQKAPGDGQGFQKSISPWSNEQLEVTVGRGKKEPLVHAGPPALRPPSQRGRHHVGLLLRQERPHGNLSHVKNNRFPPSATLDF